MIFRPKVALVLSIIDIPAIHFFRVNQVEDSPPFMLDAAENYLRIKGHDDHVLIRTAQRNGNYKAKALARAMPIRGP